ncbi:MAG TPA: ATP-binding protein [Polyangiaceae bacterium]|nr:ATP-binding protein [Polyangiaceae bacterium]
MARTGTGSGTRRAQRSGAGTAPFELSLAALESVEDAVWLCDARRATLWKNEHMARFEAQLRSGGPLGQLLDLDWIPADGEIGLPAGRIVRWTVERVDLGADDCGYAFTFRDNELSRRLAECEGRLRLLSTHTKGIIFELDSSARFVRVWASDPTLLARPEAELLGRTLLEVLGEEVGGWHHSRVLATLESGLDQEYEYEMVVPSGRRHFACSAVALPGADGQRSAAFWIRDTTDEIALRAKLMHAERLASIGTLAAGVAHEINNPLAYMLLNLGCIESLLGSSAHEAQATLDLHLSMLCEGMHRVRRIVADLLTFARTEPRATEVDVHHALDVALEAVAAEVGANARLVRSYGEAPLVEANEARLVQVFSNLLLNAAQAVPAGESERLCIEVVTSTSRDGHARIELHDSGPGVPEHLLKQIFEPFFTTRASRTGLGLPICQHIVHSCGGQITVQNRAQGGLVAIVTLPPLRAGSISP